MMKTETRSIEIRALEENEDMIVEGYAVTFNSETNLYENVYEQISSNAFNGVDFSDVRAFYDHQSSNLLGRTKTGTLQLNTDDSGLKFRLQLPNTQLGRDVYELVKRGDLSQCSFGFIVQSDTWSYNANTDTYHRTIDQIGKLVEVSLVSIPAYDDTTVAVAQRSQKAFKEQKRKLELELDILELM